ncbi:MAG: hypothetical protein ABFD62_09915 [Syntrophaceae bacterium]
MKPFKLTLASLIFLAVGLGANVWAGQFGTPQPIGENDNWSIGVGYFFNQEKVGIDDTDYTLQQNLTYLQAARSFGNFEVYLRGGSSDMLVEDYFKSDSPALITSKNDYDSDMIPFCTAGLKGFFPVDDILGVGGFIQGTYFLGKFKDDMTGSDASIPFFASTEIKNMYNISLGWALQAKLPYSIKVYAGPYLYWTRADVTDTFTAPSPSASYDASVKNKNNFGAYAGASFSVKGLTVNIEGQFSERASGGALLSYSF